MVTSSSMAVAMVLVSDTGAPPMSKVSDTGRSTRSAAAAQVSDMDVQPLHLQEMGQQAGHEHAPVPATVAQEAEDQVDAGLTLSHGPGEQGAQCLAFSLKNSNENPPTPPNVQA